MSVLQGKKILLGVCGSIAAYKSAYLIRLLVKSGVEVKVIMTDASTHFISPLTLSTLSKNRVHHEWTNDEGTWDNHVALGLWADLFLIAPASAQTLAKMAQGLCDNLLTATYLSAKCDVWIAPAMDRDMYQHPATKANMERLVSFGHHIMDATHGELASGLEGVGRMAEPEDIVEKLGVFFSEKLPYLNKNVLITAGPTREAIDPVRFIGNHSSGKMGFAIARVLAEKGAQVQLVAGPTQLDPPQHPNITIHRVTSAHEMLVSCEKFFEDAHIAIWAAAVADYKPKAPANQKIKKGEASLQLQLTRNPDIAETLGKKKKEGQFLVGFALETENELDNARKKIQSKNLDLIILNSLNDKGAGFSVDTNKIKIIDREFNEKSYRLKSKEAVAHDIVQQILVSIPVA